MTVILYDEVVIGQDPFGASIVEVTPIEVNNVLVSPVLSDDLPNQANMKSRKAIYTLAIPKGDTHTWENRIVEFFGRKWKVFNIEMEGIETLIPLSWNKKVKVERYE